MRWPLTALEQAFAGADAWPVEALLEYPGKLDGAALRAGLERLRPDFPWLWGRVRPDAIEADEAPILSVFERPDDVLGERPHPDAAAVLEVAVGAGRSLLRARISRAVADDASFFAFLIAWAHATRGEPWIAPSRDLAPFVVDLPAGGWTPARLRAALGMTWMPGILRRDPGRGAHEELPLHPSALGRAPVGASEADLVAAWCWKTLGLRWPAAGEARPLALPVDLRGRLPGLGPTFFGNATALASLPIDRDALEIAPLPFLARHVQGAVAAFDAERARDAVAAAAGFTAERGLAGWDEVHLVDPACGVLVADVARVPMERLDFGAGPPAFVHPGTRCARLVSVLPGEGGAVRIHAQAPKPLPPPRSGPGVVVRFRT